MNRRHILALTGASVAGLAGCTALGGDAEDDDPRDDSDDADTDQSTQFTASMSETETSRPIRTDVELLTDTLSDPDEPPRLEVTLTNTGDDPIMYGERRQALMWTATADETFVLLPERSAESLATFDEASEYWIAEDGFVMTEDYQIDTLEPDAAHTETLLLLVSYGASPPATEPTEFTFDTSFHASTDSIPSGASVPIEWEFTLERAADRYTVADRTTSVEIPLRYEVELKQPDIASPDAPMELEISLTNTADVTVDYGERRKALFWKRSDAGYVLYPPNAIPDEIYEWHAQSARWIATDGFAITADYQIATLKPDETHTETHYVLYRSDDDPDPPVIDELRFETDVAIEAIDDKPVDGVRSTWTLLLEADT